ncbi:hypothetical protein R1flu_019281 [Riccia fluitans]|uniref:Uncharacterized protein n=1 Tax=Riccia fluitans TaxID=41844 RepID=A0ABD1ZIE3_9MARC
MSSMSFLSSTRESDRKLRARPMNNGDRCDYDSHPRNIRARSIVSEGCSKPRLEGFYRGSWWEVDILKTLNNAFLLRYLSKDVGEEYTLLPLNKLRLKSRAADNCDCRSLKKGMDISVNCTHPDWKGLDLHPKGLYDAKILEIKRDVHDRQCTCKFQVRFYCADDEDPSANTRKLSRSSPTCVTVSTMKVMQGVGILSFDDILDSLTSGEINAMIRWSNDVFHLEETKLYLDSPARYTDNRRLKDEKHVFLPSRNPASRKMDTLRGVPAPTSGLPGQFSGSDTTDSAGYVTGTSSDPFRWNAANFSKVDTDSKTLAKGKTYGLPNTKDSRSCRSKSAFVDSEKDGARFRTSRDGLPVFFINPSSSGEKREISHQQVSKRSRSEQKDREVSYGKADVPAKNASLQKGNEDEIVDVVGGSSDEASPLLTSVPARKLPISRRYSDDGNRESAPARSTKDEGSLKPSERKPHNGVVPKVQFAYPEDDEEDCQVLQIDGNIKGSCAEVTEERSSDEDDLNMRQFKCTASNVLNPGRLRDEDPRKRRRPVLRSGSGSADRKSNGGLDTFRIATNISDARLVANSEDDSGCEVLRKDPMVKRSVAGPAEGLKAPRNKGHSVPAKPYARSENDEAVGDTSKPLNNSRPRACRTTVVTSTGTNTPASLGKSDKKISFSRRSGSHQQFPSEPLYKSLLEEPPEEEKEKPRDTTCEVERKPKCGLSADWDPTSFRYLIPTLEEKQAEIRKRNEVKEQHEQECHERQLQLEHVQQPEQSIFEEGPLEENVVLAPLQEEEDMTCPHAEVSLNEAVGWICENCAMVTTRIEELVPFVETLQRPPSGEASDWDIGRRSPDIFEEPAEYQSIETDEEVTLMNSCDLPLRMRNAMHPHQKDGFNFLWRNLACGEGSIRKMREDRNTGCILSHAPGTGKTFLVIAFLQSYINQFPTCRPMIVAPKIMLRQWEKEFQRWKSDISVYILNTARESGKRILQRHENDGLLNSKNLSSKTHLDSCRLAMLVEWKRSRSVLLVSYNLFSCLTDEARIKTDEFGNHSESSERKEVRSMLLVKPSLLVLDEGHFPRGTGTRIRRSLMAVKTNTRILLSGTLFQNNFGELFNTLYLVRPGFVERFISFVPSSDGDGHSNLKKLLEMEEVTKAAENRARRVFVEEVGMKIEQGQSRKGHSDQLDFGLERLGSLTTHFVHHHTGGVLATLPGLRDFAVILKPTQRQCHLLESIEKTFCKPTQYLERETAVSYISIHPGLVGGQSWAELVKFLDTNTARNGEALRRATATKKETVDPSDGVKTKFVFDLLRFSNPKKEKVLVFSQHIGPLDLLANMFVAQFTWREDTEYLKLDGKLSLDERQKIIEKFNNPNGEACVLLASTKACGEGISLVGASRVVFLDVLWNPAVIKQAMSRAFRLGQKRIVYVYRLIASGTVEENKYKKAIRKDWLSRAIFSVAQAKSHELTNADPQSAAEVQILADGEMKVTDSTTHGKPAAEETVGGDTTANLSVIEGIRRLRKSEELLAWEVDTCTCKDVMLERVLENDTDADRKTFVKVIEHGSDFREKTLPVGPDAREWFLEGIDDNDAVDLGDSEPVETKDVNEDEADEEDEEDM